MKVRVKRGKQSKIFRKSTYAQALPDLLRDFSGRCAYCLVHTNTCGDLEVDHFDPRLKKKKIQPYENLFPADNKCNKFKGSTWPTKQQMDDGKRFLNPCNEIDYGGQIFEYLSGPNMGRLYGTTKAAQFHIEIINLNSQYLVRKRKERTKLQAFINKKSIRLKATGPNSVKELKELIAKLKRIHQDGIPPVPESHPRGV